MTEPFHIIMPAGLDLQPNLEDVFNPDQKSYVSLCMMGLTNSSTARVPAEDALFVAWPHGENEKSPSYTECLSNLTRVMSSNGLQLTAYKLLMFAALVSSRPLSVVMTRLAAARAALKLEPFHAMLVSEGVARRTGIVPAYPEALSDSQKLAILSLAFRMLQTDDGRHIKELAIFRVIMTTLGTQDVKPEVLQASLKQSTSKLCQTLGDDGVRIGMLAMLRMATADGQTRLSEQEILRQVAQAAACKIEELERLAIFVQLETGITLPAMDFIA